MNFSITKISTFKAPIRAERQDRWITDIDNKLALYEVESFIATDRKYSFVLNSTTSMDLTLWAKPATYMKMESNLFKNNPVSYWFLTKVEGYKGDDVYKYSAVLDVHATFGNGFYDQLNGKKVTIKRSHDDRYRKVVDQGVDYLMLKPMNYGLLNSDFDVPNTKGMQLKYSGSGALFYTKLGVVDKNFFLKNQNTKYVDTIFNVKQKFGVFTYNKGDVNPTITEILINNTIAVSPGVNQVVSAPKTFYTYAIIAKGGEPAIPSRVFNSTHYVVAPIDTGMNSLTTNQQNTMATFEKLKRVKSLTLSTLNTHIFPQQI